MYRYIVGLDIGSSKVCASMGKVNSEGTMQIMGITSVSCSGLKKGAVVDIDVTSEAIEKCIFNLEKIVQFKINEAYISIQGGLCNFCSNKGIVAVESEDKEITKSDVNRALEAAKMISVEGNNEIITAIPEQFIIDGYDNIKDPIGMCGVKLEVDAKIALSQSTIINNLIKSVNNAGIKVLGITLEPIALASALLSSEEKEKGIAIVDIGYDTINISIFKGQKLCKTIFIPLGGDNITKDLSLCLNISYEEAEKLKLKYGSVIKDKVEDEKIRIYTSQREEYEVNYYTLVDIINARVDETLKFIKAFIKESGYYEEIYNIVLIGGGISFLKGIVELCENILKRPVRIGIPQYIGASNTLYATSVGIVSDVAKSIKLDRPKKTTNPVVEEELDFSIDEEDLEQNYEGSGIMGKIKEFFADFF
ncbi:cell division protein FtsA [Clostridiaceae bacterium 14S0207]|nr:cell division protein FtsA [Clostridiaceae bacterium 14S0207]